MAKIIHAAVALPALAHLVAHNAQHRTADSLTVNRHAREGGSGSLVRHHTAVAEPQR